MLLFNSDEIETKFFFSLNSFFFNSFLQIDSQVNAKLRGLRVSEREPMVEECQGNECETLETKPKSMKVRYQKYSQYNNEGVISEI